MERDVRAWSLLTTLQGSRRTRIQTCLQDKKDRWDMLKHALRVQDGLDSKDYTMLLDALDCNDSRMVHKTDLIEQSLLAMLHEMKLGNPERQKFDAIMEAHGKKFVKVAASLARARSLDIDISARNLPKTHDRLVDCVMRIRLSHEVMADSQEFWAWLEGGYPAVYRFLKVDERLRTSRTNTFVHMLSMQFVNRKTSSEHMRYVNSVCQRAMELCGPTSLSEYAHKMCDSYGSAMAEMKMLAMLDRKFQRVKVDPRIPHGSEAADLSLEFGGETYFVEISTATTLTFIGSLSKFRIDPKGEWAHMLGKEQVRELKKADMPMILILDVGHEYVSRTETRTLGFREIVCRMMPSHSELVIVHERDDVEAMSVRGGHIVGTTDLGLALEAAIARGWEWVPLPQAS